MISDLNLRDRIISLRKTGMKYFEIKNSIDCAMSTISYHCKNAGLGDSRDFRKPSIELINEWQTKYDNNILASQLSIEYNWCIQTIRKYLKIKKRGRNIVQRKKDSVRAVSSWRKEVRLKLIQHRGGKCQICGYSRCRRALEFHHIDPLTKEFTISRVSNSFERMKREVDKCILVCSNCHREIEDGLIKINKDGSVALEVEKS